MAELQQQSSTTPLLFLLDGVLSHDEERVEEALAEIRQLVPLDLSGHEDPSPCTSSPALCHVLNQLLQHRPSLASVKSHHDGSLPLHFCASLGNVAVAQIVLNQYPQAAYTPNDKGKIPLHYAAREGRIEMVHFLLRQAPETAAIASEKGKLAVHFSAGEGHAAITSALLWHYPESAAVASQKGKLPLHFCARWGFLEIAQELLSIYPDAVRALDWEGSLPLHDATREGQYHMARYLIERFPVALQTASLRGEIPLFPAVRSANVDLVSLMIQAWPAGGKHILRNASADDNVNSWNSDILELLLRGAVNNLTGCALLEGRESPTVLLTSDVEPAATLSPEELKANKKTSKRAKTDSQQQQPRLVETQHRRNFLSPDVASAALAACSHAVTAPTVSAVASMPVRSKSPILGNGSGDLYVGRRSKHDRKRSRQVNSAAAHRIFVPLHAAFETKASSHVIQHVLKQRQCDVNEKDEQGRLALHWAVTHCQQDAVVDLVLDEDSSILTPEAAATKDNAGKLPLHLAIVSHAQVRVITALLNAYPEAGVDPCCTLDQFHNKTPIHMATHYDCDLSTVFELLRVDPSFVSTQQQQ